MANRLSIMDARFHKNDEFYTTREHAIEFISHIKDDLNNKRVLIPCDTEESEIYIALIEKYPKADVVLSDISKKSFLDFNFPDFDYVITNPPFSLWKELLKKLSEDNEREGEGSYKWFFMNHSNNLLSKAFLPLITLGDWSISKSWGWKNNNKKVPIRYHSNFIEFEKKKLAFNECGGGVIEDDEGRCFINNINDIELLDEIYATVSIYDYNLKDYFKIVGIGNCVFNGKKTFGRVILRRKNEKEN